MGREGSEVGPGVYEVEAATSLTDTPDTKQRETIMSRSANMERRRRNESNVSHFLHEHERGHIMQYSASRSFNVKNANIKTCSNTVREHQAQKWSIKTHLGLSCKKCVKA